ncbi:MAG: glycosyltransferase family 39 protein, partial [Bryobacteraceae bacterium]|nr:glycosyltransferase family 39 protein [Bryobacteraceae bacterium]
MRTQAAAIRGLILVLYAATLFEAWTLGPTVDEPSHIVSSWLWWHGRDRLYPRDMPPLTKIVGGTGIAWLDLPIPPDLGKPGDTRSEWAEGAALFAKVPVSQFQIFLFSARIALLTFPILTALLLWRWSRDLFSPATAGIVTALWIFCPTVLGHSGIFKNDLAATFTYLLFWYQAWQFWRTPNTLRAATLAIATALAVLSKLSLLFLLGILPFILIARALRSRQYLMAIVWPLLAFTSVWLLTIGAYQFELHWGSQGELARLATDPAIPRTFLAIASITQFVPVPEAAWTGVVSLFKSAADPVPVYM